MSSSTPISVQLENVDFWPTRPHVLTVDGYRMGRALLRPKDGSASVPVKTDWFGSAATFEAVEAEIVSILCDKYGFAVGSQ